MSGGIDQSGRKVVAFDINTAAVDALAAHDANASGAASPAEAEKNICMYIYIYT